MPSFPLLHSPLEAGPLRLRNRVVATPLLTGLAENGRPTERQIDYYRERARGGAGLVVLESTPVHPSGDSFARSIRPWDERSWPGLRRIAEAVHAERAPVVAQLWHCGRQGSSAVTGQPLWAPSPLPCPVAREVPRAMTVAQIDELVEAFATVAETFLSAGFDGVELAAGHGYLLHQFLSPLANRRTDAYGGSDENRARLLEETLAAIRARCGAGLVVGLRLNADDLLPDGLTLADALRLVRRLGRRVDYVSVSAGTHASVEQMVGDWSVPRGNLVGLAEAVRDAGGGIPVVACGRIVEPEQAEEILRRGQADLIGLARALLADSRWAAKANAGVPRSIRPCIACNECEARLFQGLPVACAVNPELERAEEIAPAATPGTVIVVGGGPAGMEAARTAALRGHRVVLFEQGDALGGQLRLVRQLGTRDEFHGIVAFLERELARLGVDVRLGRRAGAEQLRSAGADAVVLATGAVPEGQPAGVLAPEDLAGTEGELGRRLVVWDGGVAHDRLLAIVEAVLAPGREVFVVTPAAVLGAELSFISVAGIRSRLEAARAQVLTRTDVVRVEARSLELQERGGGRSSRLQEIDTVVMVARNRPEAALRNELDGKIPRLLSAGDCVEPRGLEHAFREGRTAGLGV